MLQVYCSEGQAMPTHRDLLIVLADGEHARFVRRAESGALHSERTVDSAYAHQRAAELASDRPGASFHTGSTAHHGVAPREDPKVARKEEFAAVVAREIDAVSEAGGFDALVLAAPSHVLNEIWARLDGVTCAKIVGTLRKDLVKTPDDELASHVGAWLKRR